jgi:hypothetical protein
MQWDMSKITLLYHPDRYSNFRSVPYLEPLWDMYFNREPIDFTRTYDSNTHILTVNHLQKDEDWYKIYLDCGFRLIVDNMWDNHTQTFSTIDGPILTLRAPNWAWFNEALNYIDLGYNNITVNSNPTKFFLMLMRLKRAHRDQLLSRTQPYLLDSLYSYTSQGIMMDDDMIINGDVEQRYINPAWYESTSFSMVAESNLTSPTFMSEKTFKPIAFEQPFIVWGSPGTLDYLHRSGFETFNHVIDETYDTINNNSQRLDVIINLVDSMFVKFKQGKSLFTDAVTQQKLKHNRAHFYNQKLLSTMFTEEAVNPILEFIEQ